MMYEAVMIIYVVGLFDQIRDHFWRYILGRCYEKMKLLGS